MGASMDIRQDQPVECHSGRNGLNGSRGSLCYQVGPLWSRGYLCQQWPQQVHGRIRKGLRNLSKDGGVQLDWKRCSVRHPAEH